MLHGRAVWDQTEASGWLSHSLVALGRGILLGIQAVGFQHCMQGESLQIAHASPHLQAAGRQAGALPS